MKSSGTLKIVTPEGVQFALPLAGPVSRMLAYCIDLSVIAACEYTLSRALSPLTLFGGDAAQAVLVVLYFFVSLVYSATLEWFWRGQTVGKRLLNLRVIDAGALRLEPAQIVIRNLVRAVDALPLFYLVGGLVSVLSRNQQRLGDLAGGTVVIRNAGRAEPDFQQIAGHKYNSLIEQRHLAARLRQKVPTQVAALALEAVLRRNEFTPDSRVAVFREFAQYFRQLVPYPDELVEQLSDEQYVRNVVGVLYTRPSVSRHPLSSTRA
jgi:uncharacterized RDD family membrane protein YckC